MNMHKLCGIIFCMHVFDIGLSPHSYGVTFQSVVVEILPQSHRQIFMLVFDIAKNEAMCSKTL
jgi:hypothetical protein